MYGGSSLSVYHGCTEVYGGCSLSVYHGVYGLSVLRYILLGFVASVPVAFLAPLLAHPGLLGQGITNNYGPGRALHDWLRRSRPDGSGLLLLGPACSVLDFRLRPSASALSLIITSPTSTEGIA